MLISESDRGLAPVDNSDSNIQVDVHLHGGFISYVKIHRRHRRIETRAENDFLSLPFPAQPVPIRQFSLLGNASAKSKNFRSNYSTTLMSKQIFLRGVILWDGRAGQLARYKVIARRSGGVQHIRTLLAQHVAHDCCVHCNPLPPSIVVGMASHPILW